MKLDVSGKSEKVICLTPVDKDTLLYAYKLLENVLDAAAAGNITGADSPEVLAAELAHKELNSFLNFMDICH